MASSSLPEDLTKSKEFGRYNDGSRGGKVQRGERNVTTEEEMALIRKCDGCDKQMNKAKIPLLCPCKEVIFCSEDCRLSSRHNCGGIQEEEYDDYDKAVCQCCFLYERLQELNRGPSSSKIEKLMERTKGDQEHLLVLAEAGDPIAAYIVGEAYAHRRAVGNGFTMPMKYLERGFSETTEIAIKWLKIAAEGGVPEGMFLLSRKLDEGNGLISDRRLAHLWLAKAYGTGEMDYLIQLLESDGLWLPAEFENISSSTCSRIASYEEEGVYINLGPTLSHLLMATRCLDIRDWDGKTAMGEPFFSRVFFRKFMDIVGWNLEKKDARNSSLIFSEKKSLTIAFIAGRPGCSDITSLIVHKERYESNPRFLQGIKAEFNPDYQLIIQTTKNGLLSAIEGRTVYLVCCKHNEHNFKDARLEKKSSGRSGGKIIMGGRAISLDEFQVAGECQSCCQDALQRLKAVDKGLYSIAITQTIPRYGYAARYVNEDGVIVQDIFKAYSKPDMRQVLQCLMSNPADLHPAAVAEDQNLYWTIVWYWGSVFHAVEDTCNRNTVEAIYQELADQITVTNADASALAAITRRSDSSALAAFPESAAGEWRIACGNQDCPRVDHEVKFSLCSGCKVRRYCNEECQKKDWIKHKQFCKADKGGC